MSLWVLFFALVALFKPTGFTWIIPHISLMLGVVMFGMGMMLKFEDFKLILQRPKEVLLGALAQFSIMPLLAVLLLKVFNLPQELALGVLLVGTCPGGTASNVITYLAKGDMALSVSMTMLTTLLSPLVTPLLMLILGGEKIEVAFLPMMLSICKVVILPITLGILINKFFGSYLVRGVKYLPLISITAIILIVGGIVGVNATKIMEIGLTTALVVILHNLAGFALGFLVAKAFKLERSKTKAICIEVGMQNSGLASSLALTHFGVMAAIPGALFSVWHNIAGSMVANYLASQKSITPPRKG
ncbi:MAG: bile acid:sodium symporter family protein [Desulfovibrionaceae bacterium]|nr:bile acid:sodium symporter family protein [Desulfovibrionaceae bacterium]